jgi:hypothetical protein
MASGSRRPARPGGAQRQLRPPLDGDDAEAGERAEPGPDDHRADDHDRRVLVDADCGERARLLAGYVGQDQVVAFGIARDGGQ